MKLVHMQDLLFVRSRMVSVLQSEQGANEGVISVLQQHFENKKESLEMRKMRKKVVLIGTGLIGGSLALAIKKEHDITITGYDIFQEQVERAKELHVVDEIAVDLQHACEEAHLIVLLLQLKKQRSYYTNLRHSVYEKML